MKYRYVKRNYNYVSTTSIQKYFQNFQTFYHHASDFELRIYLFIYFSNQIFMPNTLNLDSKLMELVADDQKQVE